MNKLTLDALQVLEAIDRCGSFALAAKELHRVPSALTYTVRTLETQLGITIFDRSGHRAKLTSIGRMLVDEGARLLLNAEQLEKRIHLHQFGFEEQLCVAYDQLIPFKNLLFLIEDFYQQCAGVELKVTAEVLGGCWDALFSNRAAIAIGVADDPPLHDDLTVMPLGKVDFVFVVSKDHPLAKKKNKLTYEDIIAHRSIAVTDTTRGLLPRRTTGILPEQTVLTVNTFDEKIAALLTGVGVGYLPTHQAEKYIQRGELIEKEIPRLQTEDMLSIAWRPSLMGKAGHWLIEQLSDQKNKKRILSV